VYLISPDEPKENKTKGKKTTKKAANSKASEAIKNDLKKVETQNLKREALKGITHIVQLLLMSDFYMCKFCYSTYQQLNQRNRTGS
jgi:hypothetical protein